MSMDYIKELKKVIESKSISQELVARDLNVTLVTLNRWLNKKAIPRKSAENKIKTFILKSDITQIDTVRQFDLDLLVDHIYSEIELKNIAFQIKKESSNILDCLVNLIDLIPEKNRNYDWNIGSILQYFDPEILIDAIKKIDNVPRLHNSIGLSWVLGEINRKDIFVMNYLKDVVRYSTDGDAMWRAAFSLENLDDDEEAIVILKRTVKIDKSKTIEYYIDKIEDKKSLVAILIMSNSDNLQHIIYPKVKEAFLETKDIKKVINCCWLIGRFGILDREIINKITKNINTSNYELKYYTYFALQHNSKENLRDFFESGLKDINPLIRKMSCKALRKIGNEKSLQSLEDLLFIENDINVVPEVARAIYSIKNPAFKTDIHLQLHSIKNENGMISDETDKWYKDAALYDLFSEAEDPQNVCFDLVKKFVGNKKIINPIDLATGTGRYLLQIKNKMDYEGYLYGIDYSIDMCNFLEKRIKREKLYVSNIKVINCAIEEVHTHISEKSNFIMSSFGFPSRITDKKKVIQELRAVYETLSEDGIFVTMGWDETFNDSLNYMWFKYVPDNIQAKNFEEWRRKRTESIQGARNCGLTWFKKGIIVPLQYSSASESVDVMGYLFGRDAAKSIISSKKVNWNMSMGITIDTKESLKKIIQNHERNRNPQ